jgi:hypothetical protein
VGWTTPEENQDWKAQSIVTGTGGTFNYTKTAMSAWLCASVNNGQSCNGGANPQYCMNNSSAQGQLFYQQVALTPPPNFAVYAVQNCDGAEGVNGQYAVVPGSTQQCSPGQYCGRTAIRNDMTNPLISPAVCKKN